MRWKAGEGLRSASRTPARDHQRQPSVRVAPPAEPPPELSVSAKQSRAAWARLIKKVYDADALRCARCHRPMKIIAVIIDLAQVLKILMHLVQTQRPPPDLDPTCLL